MKKYAMVLNNVVENICLWDGEIRSEENPNAWEPPAGYELIDVEEMFCDIGWSWDGQSFINPNPAPVVDIVEEEQEEPQQ